MLVGGGIFLLGNFLVFLIAGLMGFMLALVMSDFEQSKIMISSRILGWMVGPVLSFTFLPFLYGYLWESVSQIKLKGFEHAELPQ